MSRFTHISRQKIRIPGTKNYYGGLEISSPILAEMLSSSGWGRVGGSSSSRCKRVVRRGWEARRDVAWATPPWSEAAFSPTPPKEMGNFACCHSAQRAGLLWSVKEIPWWQSQTGQGDARRSWPTKSGEWMIQLVLKERGLTLSVCVIPHSSIAPKLRSSWKFSLWCLGRSISSN